MTNAFFADMGGFLVQAPESTEFPLDAEQLYYLVIKKFIEYPEIDKEEIEDKNKADGLARYALNFLPKGGNTDLESSLITVCQATWFTINSVARPVQGLFLTTLELTALSFIVVFFAVSFCWLHKPMGVSRPITLRIETKIEVIVQQV
jgi:hypothetical protein